MEKAVSFHKPVIVIASIVATVLLVCGITAPKAFAEPITATSGDFTFTIYDDGGGYGSLWVTKYSGSATEVELPTSVTYNGTTYGPPKMAPDVGSELFAGNATIVKVAIPAGFDGIGNDTFKGCPALTEVAVADTVSFIGDTPFTDCPNLKTYRIAGTNLSGTLSNLGIGQDSAGNVYPNVTVYTVKGSAIDEYIQSVNAKSMSEGNGNQIKLFYEADPYAGRTVKPGSGQDSSGTGAASGLGEDNTALGKGASAAAAEAFLIAYSSENDPAGTVFGLLQAKMSKVTKSSIKISWKKAPGAASYAVYGNLCGKKNKYVAQTTITKTSLAVKKVNGKKVKKGTYYKFIVVALDKNGKVVSTSKTVHAATAGGKVGNDKKVTTKAKKNKVALKKGKTFKLKGKAVAASKKLKVKKHRGIAYESDNAAVATVTKAGVVKGVKKGTANVYAYAQDGACAKIKVTVK